MKVRIVIPARMASTRLPRKVLLKETGKPLVQHVVERARLVKGAQGVLVATDHDDIRSAVEGFGGEAVMTSADHPSGSDRVAEAVRKHPCDVVVNLQADEPEIDPGDVDALIGAMTPDVPMATLVFDGMPEEEQGTPSVVKAVVKDGWAVDFRREPTPGGLRHLGIYAYRTDFLLALTKLPPSAREKERRLEQMRALDNGHRIRAVLARRPGAGIDTPEDYARFLKRWRSKG